MAGLTCAQFLREGGLSVALLEKGFCGAGASGKSSGFITPASELELSELIAHFGIEPGPRAVGLCRGRRRAHPLEHPRIRDRLRLPGAGLAPGRRGRPRRAACRGRASRADGARVPEHPLSEGGPAGGRGHDGVRRRGAVPGDVRDRFLSVLPRPEGRPGRAGRAGLRGHAGHRGAAGGGARRRTQGLRRPRHPVRRSMHSRPVAPRGPDRPDPDLPRHLEAAARRPGPPGVSRRAGDGLGHQADLQLLPPDRRAAAAGGRREPVARLCAARAP